MVNGREIRAVLYDFDGTLADTTALVMECYRLTMQQHLGEVPPAEKWLRGFGTPLDVQMNRFARDRLQCEEMIATYRWHQEEQAERFVRPFPGVMETLDTLRDRGTPMAIVTSRHRESTLRAIDLCGLTERFGEIITPEDVGSPKPHPEPVLMALSRLDVDPGEALFVGDSPHDIAAGKAAGTATAGVLWGPFARSVLAAEGPTHLFRHPRDVLSVLSGPFAGRASPREGGGESGRSEGDSTGG